MVIVGRIILEDANGSGRVEVTVSHNVQPGSWYEAEQTYSRVRNVLVSAAGDSGNIILKTEGWAG
jgi:hypothetical protein